MNNNSNILPLSPIINSFTNESYEVLFIDEVEKLEGVAFLKVLEVRALFVCVFVFILKQAIGGAFHLPYFILFYFNYFSLLLAHTIEQQFLFVGCLLNTIPPFSVESNSFFFWLQSSWYLMSFVNCKNKVLTLNPDRALVSMNLQPNESANCFPCSKEIALLWVESFLFPISMTIAFSLACCCMFLNQLVTF